MATFLDFLLSNMAWLFWAALAGELVALACLLLITSRLSRRIARLEGANAHVMGAMQSLAEMVKRS